MPQPETAEDTEITQAPEVHEVDLNDPDTPPIDIIIANFDKSLNELRTHASKMPGGAASKSMNDVLAALTAAQAFMREVRRLFGDIL